MKFKFELIVYTGETRLYKMATYTPMMTSQIINARGSKKP